MTEPHSNQLKVIVICDAPNAVHRQIAPLNPGEPTGAPTALPICAGVST